MLLTTQNVQGMSTKIDEMISSFHLRGVYACMLAISPPWRQASGREDRILNPI